MKHRSSPSYRENPLLSLLVNVILPVAILNQVGKRLGENGPFFALILALALPISYGIWDWLRHHHRNYVSLFGVLSVVLTGGFALARLEGIWFAIKEAALPGVMALGVAASAFSQRPLIAVLFLNDQLLNLSTVEQRLEQKQTKAEFARLLKRSTLWLSLSFVLSAILNYVIARRIFVDLDPALSSDARDELLNSQIAKMTGMGFVAIAIPMMVFTGLVLYLFLKRLTMLTDLKFDDLIKR